jgi:hypothetical protein
MAFLKAHWQFLAMGAVCLVSIAAGVLAVLGTSDVEAKMKEIDGLRQKVADYQRSPVNRAVIEAKKQELDQRKVEFDSSMQAALARQMNNAFYEEPDADGNMVAPPRKPLMEGVLPEPASFAEALTFRSTYKEAFKQLPRRLKARGRPTAEERQIAQDNIGRLKPAHEEQGLDARGPSPESTAAGAKQAPKLEDVLRESAIARAAEGVALTTYMYIDDGAFGQHPFVGRVDTPTAVDIWQAQMSLWIQQDIATALARCNEERIAQLKKDGHDDQLWVAYMPVKRLEYLSIADDQLGKAGLGGPGMTWRGSFTGLVNDEKRFVVPLELKVIVEAASVPSLTGHLCSVGFYTPVAVAQKAVAPDPLYENEFVYGEAPVVELTIDLEAYYFRAVFDQWIPKSLKSILKTPNCKDDEATRAGRG